MFALTAFTILATYCLLLIGGVVHATGSSLACPDWSFVPLCFGQVLPEMKGGVLFEHGHRLWASGVGLLTIAIVALAFRKRHLAGGRLRLRLAIGALVLVCIQGTLGGITVLYKLPWQVSSAHLGTSMLFFGLLLLIAFVSAPKRMAAVKITANHDAARGLSLALPSIATAVLLCYAQILLGASVRHLSAGMSCTDLPLCFGQIWPTNAHFTAKLHMAHRLLGIVALLAICLAAFRIWKSHGISRLTRGLAIAAPTIAFAQIALGVWAVASYLAIESVTLHLAGAAALWGTLLVLLFQAAECRSIAKGPTARRTP